MDNLKIEYVDINTLKEYEKNAKLHPQEQIEQIKKSIQEFNMIDPIGVWKDNSIIEGNGRYKACMQLGIKEVPIIRLDHLSDEERKAYTLAHNKLTMNSDFDLDILNDELDDILNIDMSDFGFDIDFEDEEEKEIIEDEVPEVPEEPKAKLGDIYQLGNHRLMCGDSTSEEDVAKLMNGVKADMVFTDPPYNVNYQEKEKRLLKYRPNERVQNNQNIKIENDNLGNDFKNFCNKLAKIIKKNTIGCVYICGAVGKDGRILFTEFDNELHNSTTIIWNKNHFVLGDGKYQNNYEPIWFGWVENGKMFCDDRTLINVWNIDKPMKSELHPTMKPIELCSTAIKHNSKSEIVLDLFGGSGSTLIACEQLNRKCYMMELDEHYIDVIIQRWENFTGGKAVKLN